MEKEFDYYKLIDKTPVPCNNLLEWALWFETSDRIVKQTQVGPLLVSTIFMGINHNFLDKNDPILFETMIFDGGNDDYQIRSKTWDQAEKEHQKAIIVAEGLLEKANNSIRILK